MEASQNGHEDKSHQQVYREHDVEDKEAQFFARIQVAEEINDLHVHEQSGHSETRNKRKVVLIIPFPNTHSHPRTMVVKPLHTSVADRAVRSPWRSVYIAGIAEFHPQMVSLDAHRIDLVHH